jgi:ATP-dependent DNA helicase RecG
LARFFTNIGRADVLGSGVRNLYKFTKLYSGGEPELSDGDVFTTIVPMNSGYGEHENKAQNKAQIKHK